MKRIEAASQIYLNKTSAARKLPIRYDICFIIGTWRVQHIKDAWRHY